MSLPTNEGRTAQAVKGLWERIKAEEKAERGEAAPDGRAGRRSARPARANPRLEAAGQGRPRRLRLERPARRSRQDPRGSRRDRSRARCRRQGASRERSRRSAVRGGQSGAPHGAPTRKACCAPPTSNSSAALPRSRPRSPRAENGRRTPPWPRWTRCGMRRRLRRRQRIGLARRFRCHAREAGIQLRVPACAGTSGIFCASLPLPIQFSNSPPASSRGSQASSPVFFGRRRVRRIPFPLPLENRGARDAEGPAAHQVHAGCATERSDPRASTPRDIEACRSPVKCRKSAKSQGVPRAVFEVCSASPPVDLPFQATFLTEGRLSTALGPGRDRQSCDRCRPRHHGARGARQARRDGCGFDRRDLAPHLRCKGIPRPPLPAPHLKMLYRHPFGIGAGCGTP